MPNSHNEQLRIIKAKDISIYLVVSNPTSFLIYKDIKNTYNIKRVCLYHLFDYLKIPIIN